MRYQDLHRSGELDKRVVLALDKLAECQMCPWNCGVNRLHNEQKVCLTGRHARVSSCFPHHGEEDCLKGWNGSGTIFFSCCNLRCIFCQNYDISQFRQGTEVDAGQLADLMLGLQDAACHNINLVTPEHVVPQIIEALALAIAQGLSLPIVYNTSSFDSMDSLKLLDGIVDIYMPDFKFWTQEASKKYLRTPDYPETASVAIREMHRQVGDLQINANGLASSGLLVRHLIMPGMMEETKAILYFLASEISKDTYINIMDQYYPSWKVNRGQYTEINRRISSKELKEAYRLATEAGLWRFDKHKRIN